MAVVPPHTPSPVPALQQAHLKFAAKAVRSWHGKCFVIPFLPGLGTLISPWSLFSVSQQKSRHCGPCPGSPGPHQELCVAQASELERILPACWYRLRVPCVCLCSLKCVNQRVTHLEFCPLHRVLNLEDPYTLLRVGRHLPGYLFPASQCQDSYGKEST